MRRIPITNHGGLDETRVARVQDMVAEHRSLDQIFVVLVPLPDGTWIVYGTT